MDVASIVPVWVRLPHLPLHCWGDDSVKAIENVVGKYIDRCEQKENMHACARICIEVDLGKGLSEAIKIKVNQWTHIQHMDYEKLPFICKLLVSPHPLSPSPKVDNTSSLISLNPFGPLDLTAPPSPRSPPHPHNSSATPPLSNIRSPPAPLVNRIITRNQSKKSLQTTKHKKEVGKKSNKDLRDEAAAKEMALGTQ
eukprot:PITA_03918